jgi:polyamine oxidase
VTGITAAQALANASIDDFIILEYRDRLGGRLRHEEFGEDENGDPYVVELGANWVHGVGMGVRENPIWQLVRLSSEPRQILTAPGKKTQLDSHTF